LRELMIEKAKRDCLLFFKHIGIVFQRTTTLIYNHIHHHFLKQRERPDIFVKLIIGILMGLTCVVALLFEMVTSFLTCAALSCNTYSRPLICLLFFQECCIIAHLCLWNERVPLILSTLLMVAQVASLFLFQTTISYADMQFIFILSCSALSIMASGCFIVSTYRPLLLPKQLQFFYRPRN